MVSFKAMACLVLAAFPALTLAHPKNGPEAAKLLGLHRRTAAAGTQALIQCKDTIEARSYNQAAADGRVGTLNAIRQAAGLGPVSKLGSRNLNDLKFWENKNTVNHDKTGKIGGPSNAWAKTEPQCAFVPEDVVGPYYYPGELVRSDISEGLAGVPMWLDVQLIDVNTCKPINGMTVDVWASNAVGKYSHIPVSVGQAGIKSRWQRGALRTRNHGRAVFKMIFPGHYDGRATHAHIMARDAIHAKDRAGKPVVIGEEKDANVHHIGQAYFDDALRQQVERTSPYNSNKQSLLSNDEDAFARDQAGKQYDPFVNYVFMNGKNITSGIYAWISIGINPKASKGQNQYPSGRPWKQ
ncbi:putative gpi anchored [Venturia nashicola]|uniref:Putative gpi anchored n=1 Tax=Venturia nashicola TaxID=86259 RepID=A0A4Z1P3X8_9PEZI|nr:putative gpi anchored [Venturia nashicola]